MNKRFHLFAAVLGLIFTVAFAIVPLSSADQGPHVRVPNKAVVAAKRDAGPKPIRRHMDRRNVVAKDDGCGS